MKTIVLFGGASEKIIATFKIQEKDYEKNLMNYLHAQNINIASSCRGEGICQKCLIFINEKPLLSCQKKISDIFHNTESIELKVSYL